MKNIAICFYGQLRGDDETFLSTFKNLVSINNCDVFIHTWNYYDKEYIKENTSINKNDDASIFTIRENLDLNKLNKFINIFKPKKVLVEEQKTFDNTNHISISGGNIPMWSARYYQSVKSQAYSKKKSSELIDNINDYDLIIILRNDLIFNHEINLNEVNLDSNQIMCKMTLSNKIEDYIFCSTPLSTIKMVEFYNTQDDIYINNRGTKCEFNEFHIYTHLINNSVSINNYNFNVTIKRPENEK
jgi:hypothetical protein